MLFRHFCKGEGFEPFHRKISEKFKADLSKLILNLPFLICIKVYKFCETVLSGITKTRGTKQSGLFLYPDVYKDRDAKNSA